MPEGYHYRFQPHCKHLLMLYIDIYAFGLPQKPEMENNFPQSFSHLSAVTSVGKVVKSQILLQAQSSTIFLEFQHQFEVTEVTAEEWENPC